MKTYLNANPGRILIALCAAVWIAVVAFLIGAGPSIEQVLRGY